MPPSYFKIDVPKPWDSVPAEEQVWLQVVIACEKSLPCAVAIPAIQHKKRDSVDVDVSMVPRDLRLLPGEVCVLTIGFRFRLAGTSDLSDIIIQVNPDEGSNDFEAQLIKLPAHSFRVVPSLAKEIRVSVARICQYEAAVKVEVEIEHHGSSELRDVEWIIGPEDRIRSGVTRRRLLAMQPGVKLRYEMVVVGKQIEIDITAKCQGERVSTQQALTILETSETQEQSRTFRFLEPRNFTKDTITIKPEKETKEVVSTGGVFPVFGGKSRYDVTILTNNPNATSVKLLPVAGQVEATSVAKNGRASLFVITVVENPVFRQTVRLDYIVMVDGQSLQGEIYLSIRPTNGKLWMVALTAGLALTAKGLFAVVPAVFHPDSTSGLFEHVGSLFEKQWSDLAQIASVPVIRGVLWLIDVVMRQFDDV